MATDICTWAGLWEAAPDMDVARQAHTATVLKNGKILICGGTAAAVTVGTALLYDPVARTYAPAGTLAVPRHGHQATRLNDGNVLVTGGWSSASGQQLASSELYNWLARTWTLLPAQMSSRRQDHTATLTGNGNVLLVGGFGGTQPNVSNILDTIEIYDLASQSFSAISHKMQAHRMGHTATMLPTGVILIAGGQDANGPVKQAETYDPAHPPFAPVGELTVPRALHTATLLPDGSVLLAGGFGPQGIHQSADRFSGATFSAIGNMASARAGHAAVDLGEGQVLICGGENAGGPLASVELYHHSRGVFETGGTMATPRDRPAAAPTGDGGAIVFGGKSTAGTSGIEVKSSERFDPLFRPTKGRLPGDRRKATATRLGTENALVIGGQTFTSTGPQSLASVLLYRGATDAFTQVGSLVTPRFDHTATLLASPDRILVVGGISVGSQGVASAELFDVASSAATPAGAPSGARSSHTATVLANGKVLVVGGVLAGAPLATAELYDPATNAFSATGGLSYGRHGHTATLLPDGRVLVAGGMSTDSAVPGGTGVTFTTEIYDPATGAFTLQPQPNRMLVNRTHHTATVLADGRVLFAGGLSVGLQPTSQAERYDPASNVFTATGAMAGPRWFHAAVRTGMPNGQVMIVGGSTSFSGPNAAVVELYDPVSGTFTQKGRSWFARSHHAALMTTQERIVVIGGSVDGDPMAAELSKPTNCTAYTGGPGGSGGSGSGCFIATAAFGSDLHPEVERLRRFRDAVLMPSAAGRLLVRAYYRGAPPVAAVVRRSAALRAVVRFVLGRLRSGGE